MGVFHVNKYSPLETARCSQHLSLRQVRKLKNVTDPIRKEAWDKWTSEITTLFPTETKAVYYSPFRLIDGRAIQASGLIVNRLITVRRKLAPHHRRSSSVSSENSSSSGGKKRKTDTESQTRVRPLPEFFSLKNISNQSTAKENLQWLKFSSSPRDLVDTKWKDCLRERLMVLQEGGHLNYFLEFPALQCPWGYELLASDFENICPDAKGKFEENYGKMYKMRIAGAETPQKQQIASLLHCRVFAVSQYRRGAAGICEQPSCDWCNLNGAATSHHRRRVARSGGVRSASNSPFLRHSFAR
ncbi:hypothetical protein ACJJTC_000220 [Scirpophaga incertulas]